MQPVPLPSKRRGRPQNPLPHPAITMAFAGKRNEQERKKLEKTDVKISEARLFNADGKFWLREVHAICILTLFFCSNQAGRTRRY